MKTVCTESGEECDEGGWCPPHTPLSEAAASRTDPCEVRDDWKDLVTRLIEEYRACCCPYGSCDVYPHPVLHEAAAAAGWEPPEGQQL